MPPYLSSCFIGVHVINCWAVSAQPCIIFSTPGFSSVIKKLSTSEEDSSLLVRKRDRFLNKYFYWKTGRDKLGIRARLTVGSH